MTWHAHSSIYRILLKYVDVGPFKALILPNKEMMMFRFRETVLFITFLLKLASIDACNIDLGVILDDSTSIGMMGLMDETRFVRDLTRLFTISSVNTRVSVLTYSNTASMKIYFNSRAGQDKWKLDFELMKIVHAGGGTKTHLALEMARKDMFTVRNGARPGVPKMLLLLTDGRSQSDATVLKREATLIKDQFINIMSIGIGNKVRRTELAMIASEPTGYHVFLVTGLDVLNRVASTIRKEACKVNTCSYFQCIYNDWSSWSGTCHTVTRTKTVRQSIKKSKTMIGGCAGLNVYGCKPVTETKNIAICLRNCNYVECNYGKWSQWSTTCGRGERRRNMQAIRKTTQRVDCTGLPQTCSNTPDIQIRNQKCSCNYVECKYGAWSAWTTSCGTGHRFRQMQTIKKTVQRENCNGLPTSCRTAPDIESRSQSCLCNYVECKYGAWSAWTTSCGKGQRSRQMQTIKKTVQRNSCNGLPTSCPIAPYIESRIENCLCNYVECKYGAWSAWTTSCGKGQRSRQMQTIKKTAQRESCNGLPTSCQTDPDIESRSQNCSCDYVECKYGAWSAWTTSCGKGQRSRQMQTIKKTIQRESCNGLPTSCPTKPDTESRTKMCNCNYVECRRGQWSAWSTTCNEGERIRFIETLKKTTEQASCEGLPLLCPNIPQVEKRNRKCLKCHYVECTYMEWTNWNPACGKNMERKRTLQTINKTIEKDECSGLKTTCTDAKEQFERKEELCECDTVECIQQWTAWSATCGPTKRTLRYVTKPIKVRRESCDGLKTTCPSTTETQVDDIPCPKTLPPVITTEVPASDEGCRESVKPIGCVKDNRESRKRLQKLYADANVRSKSSEFADLLKELLCKCARQARSNGFNAFALSSQGNCFGGNETEEILGKDNIVNRSMCVNTKQEDCSEMDEFCAGRDATLFAYKIEG